MWSQRDMAATRQHTRKAIVQLRYAERDSFSIKTDTWIDTGPMIWAEVRMRDEDEQRIDDAVL